MSRSRKGQKISPSRAVTSAVSWQSAVDSRNTAAVTPLSWGTALVSVRLPSTSPSSVRISPDSFSSFLFSLLELTTLWSSDKPDPPAKVPAASDIRRSSLTLSWYGPTYDGGSAVTAYHLEIWDSVEQQWKPLVSCNSTSYNVQVTSAADVLVVHVVMQRSQKCQLKCAVNKRFANKVKKCVHKWNFLQKDL